MDDQTFLYRTRLHVSAHLRKAKFRVLRLHRRLLVAQLKIQRAIIDKRATRATASQTLYTKLPPELRIQVLELVLADEPTVLHMLPPGLGSSLELAEFQVHDNQRAAMLKHYWSYFAWLLTYRETRPELWDELQDVVQRRTTLVFDFSFLNVDTAFADLADYAFNKMIQDVTRDNSMSVRHIRVTNVPTALLILPNIRAFGLRTNMDLYTTADRKIRCVTKDALPSFMEEASWVHLVSPLRSIMDPLATLQQINKAQTHILECWQGDLSDPTKYQGESENLVTNRTIIQSLSNLQRFAKAQYTYWNAARTCSEEGLDKATLDQLCTYCDGVCNAGIRGECTPIDSQVAGRVCRDQGEESCPFEV
ncbi:hypothetical protein EJ05DRAFT_499997 [Pseudovirgaria hyperparasitica]|uniref:Uncharacterized protein n=1 Tax=Pseudovirgaria hyperparasitica TaxID=470096 RepID=A0A6A6W8X6_9PEZI|nr:uncharacterized protein EJ05DRAFT_499997 [Pseudovirgaria hyperparasitica]KAF2758474.1 hypothetical protein EJ05DRAFT_499997 [Pseudovirgaria hyperparasitica]